MANDLAAYNPYFYAQEALIALEDALGLARTVHRGYDKAPQQRGDTIKIRVPGTFTAASAPATAEDIDTDEVEVVLDQWMEVKFKLTDKELSETQQVLIDDHIRPAAYALAQNIDTTLNALYTDIPWEEAAASTADVSDIVNCRKILFDNGVPMRDGDLWAMVSPTIEAEFLQASAFAQWQGAGATGVETQLTGSFGRRYGFEFFANQNIATHTAGALVPGTQLQLNAAITAGDTSVVMKDSGASLTGTVKAGDTFVIVGNTQRYAVTADATAAGNLITVAFTPAAVQGYSDSDNVTISQDTGEQSLFYHRNWAALAMAPLPTIGNELGARIASIPDPKTGLALRSRMYYVGNSSEVHVAIDVLYGVKTLQGNRAVRLVD
jgi:hypothetical protein